MMRYKCKKTFLVDKYDNNGFLKRELITVYEGEIFKEDLSEYRLLGNDESIRLENDRIWLELERTHILDFFEEVEE